MHDFNTGITTNGVFWIAQIPDDAVVISGDMLTIHVANLPVADEVAFLGAARIPSTVSFDITYTKSGKPRIVVPSSPDPLSAFHWAGKMWMAANSGTVTVYRNDGSFLASGSFSSSGSFGEMGSERNGVFLAAGDTNTQSLLQPLEQPAEVQSLNPAMLPAPLRSRAGRGAK